MPGGVGEKERGREGETERERETEMSDGAQLFLILLSF